MPAKETVAGARPPGVPAGNEDEAARVVREMFGRVAPRYDLLNHLLSGQVDRYWRWRLVREVRPYLRREHARIADLCCGTGDLALALERERRRLRTRGGPPMLACDFCRPMLLRAQRKVRRARARCSLAEADATRMPMPDWVFDLITIAYGFRNLANYRSAATEFARLLAPGGCVAIPRVLEARRRPVGRDLRRLFPARAAARGQRHLGQRGSVLVLAGFRAAVSRARRSSLAARRCGLCAHRGPVR